MVDSDSKKAVVLLSGGLDSATTAAIAASEGYAIHALSVDYGQRHRFELEAAARVAESLGAIEHRVVSVGIGALGGSALTDDIPVPQGRSDEEISTGIPVTYVPARNTVFLSLALGYAEVIGAWDLWIGVNAVDYSGYPDCRPEFIDAFSTLASLATKAGVESVASVPPASAPAEQANRFRIHTPLISLTKAQIVQQGTSLGVDYSLTHTCYSPNAQGVSCGKCDACLLRLKGFEDAGLADPIQYQSNDQ